MARLIVLLRAVNVGGTGKLRMTELSNTLQMAGYRNVKTVLASGNIVLDTTKTPTAKLASRLENLLTEQHGLSTDIMVRTPAEWAAMINANPMPEAAQSTPSAFGVMVIKGKLDTDALTSFTDHWKGPEQIEAGEGCIYIHFPNGMGQSKLKLPQTIGIGTLRNWNTVCKLKTLAATD
jgi:uncharacterized protein (DUF1697 family)